MDTNILLIANSNILDVNGLRNGLTNDFINTAVVVVTIEDLKGNELTGETWPLVVPYVPNSDGCYKVGLNSALALDKDQRYKLTIAVQGDGLDARWEKFITAKNRH